MTTLPRQPPAALTRAVAIGKTVADRAATRSVWSRLRGPAVSSRVGLVLGILIAISFLTGLCDHFLQHPLPFGPGWPTRPVWIFRLTQGLHVALGVAMIPLIVVKLWSVFPKLFERPLVGSLLQLLERGSILVLMAAMLFEISTGLINISLYYPWKFFFPQAHYAMAFLMVGAVVVHVAVKLPIIRRALSAPVETPEPGGGPIGGDDPSGAPGAWGPTPPGPGRRTVLVAAFASAGVAALAIAGQTIGFLRWVSVLAPRTGLGPQGVPINRTAAGAGTASIGADYRLVVRGPHRQVSLSYADLTGMPQAEAKLPIACVEGWSATAHWTGVRMRDLLAGVADGLPESQWLVRVTSLEKNGIYATSTLPARFATDDLTLVALRLNGDVLTPDHGYPCRLIAPGRPGVLQTKWLGELVVGPA